MEVALVALCGKYYIDLRRSMQPHLCTTLIHIRNDSIDIGYDQTNTRLLSSYRNSLSESLNLGLEYNSTMVTSDSNTNDRIEAQSL